MPVLMGRFSVRMHMFMNEVYLEQQGGVAQYIFRWADCLNPVAFRQESNSGMQLVNQRQIVRGNHQSLAGKPARLW